MVDLSQFRAREDHHGRRHSVPGDTSRDTMRAMPVGAERERSRHRGGPRLLPYLLRHPQAPPPEQRGETWRVTFPPMGLGMFYKVLAANFGIMKVVFLGVIVYEAWFIPRPIKLVKS